VKLRELKSIIMRPDVYKEGLKNFSRSFSCEFRERAVLVEIGSYAGESTEILSKGFYLVFAIDPWDSNPESMDSSSTERYNAGIVDAEKSFDYMRQMRPNIIKLKGNDDLFTYAFSENSIDVLYIDGFHTFEDVKKNIFNWYLKVKVGGFICGHDYKEETPGVIQAVDAVLGQEKELFDDTSWKFLMTQDLKERIEEFYEQDKM